MRNVCMHYAGLFVRHLTYFPITSRFRSVETIEVQSTADDTTAIKLLPCAKDAYFLFQDLCLLTNGERPVYLKLSQLTKTFGLELIESVLTNHFKLFQKASIL